MIDRTYLPFQSAREYQDVKMQKWMGFFLSEHTSALSDDNNKVSILSEMTLEQKLLLVSQVYANQLTIRVQIQEKNAIKTYTGTIPSITQEYTSLKTDNGHLNIRLSDVFSIELMGEEKYHESA